MTTATEPEAFQALDEAFERIPIDRLHESKTNPRHRFDQKKLDELTESVREKGIIEPIVVRPMTGKKDAYEVVAGARRLRAARAAGRTHVPSVIRNYSDNQILELMLVENIQRDDLTPLEQAKGYRALIDSNPTKHSAESIAARIGMSPAWVWDRMKLLDLVPEAKQLLEGDRISVGHAILIARLKPADQKRVVDPGEGRNGYRNDPAGLWQFDHAELELDDVADKKSKDPYHRLKPVSVRELEHWIHDHIRFDVAHMAKAVPLAFEQTAAKVEEAAAKPGRGKKIIHITHEYRVADDARDESERTYGSQSWHRADGQDKSKTCECSVLGLVVAGRGQGETFDVCVARDKCRVHFGDVIRTKEKAQQLRDEGKTKKAAKVEKRAESSWEAEERKRKAEYERWDRLKGHAVKVCAAKTKDKPLTNAVLEDVLGRILDYSGTLKEVEALLGGKVTAKTFVRALAIVDILERDNTREYFQPVAKKYGVDLAKLEKELGGSHTSGVKGTKASKSKKAAA